jgi:hypothetical protein
MDCTLFMPDKDMLNVGFDQLVIELHRGSARVAEDRIHSFVLQRLDDDL